MRKNTLMAAIILVCFWLNVTTSVFASGEEDKDKNVLIATDNKNSTTDKDSKNSKDEKSIKSNLSIDEQMYLLNEKVRKLEQLVEKQQQIIEVLQTKASETNTPTTITTLANKVNENESAASNTATTVASTSSTNSANSTINVQPQGLNEDQQKKLESLVKAFGAININGDFRFRYDGQYDQGFDAPVSQPDRNRIRVQVRLGLSGQLNKNLDWAIQVSTGELTDPISNNQTVTDFFNRKAVGFNRYFLRYDSKVTEGVGVILQGGKFDYPWKRTELTFDNDLQPEGATETIYYKSKGILKDARLIAFQLPFFEASGGKDSALFGGQVQATFSKGNWSFIPSTTFLNFNQTDIVARNLNRSVNQVGGGIAAGTTNRVRRDAAGNIIGFLANYNILDIIGEVRYTGSARYPVSLLFNYARNMSDRLERLKERNAYWAEFKVGQLKEKGDIEVGYLFARVQQDAVLSVFAYSDFLATNSRSSRASIGYTLSKSVFVKGTVFFTERFNVLKGVDNRTSKRVHLDINYRF